MSFIVLFLLVNSGILVYLSETEAANGKLHLYPVINTRSTITISQISSLDYDQIYTDWSSWSRCSKRCRQRRTRLCKSPEQCSSNILREEKICFTGRCRYENNSLALDKLSGQKRKDPSLQSKYHVLYYLENLVYSQWSTWSPCTRQCKKRRFRTCEMSLVCGTNVVREDKVCYVEGTSCTKVPKKGRKRKRKKKIKEESFNEADSVTDVDINHEKMENKCGMVKNNNDLLRIIGGREAMRGGWPWQISILNKSKEPFCGGTLLSPYWVVTAAHCIRHRLYVRAGEHDLMIEEGSEQEVRVSDAFEHPGYDSNTVDNDIALLKLKHPVVINDRVKPVCLPNPGEDLPVDTRAVILGWGKRRNSAVFGTDVLNQAEVPVVSMEECRVVYEEYYISNNMFCAGYKRGRVDSCAGDSGGPLLFKRSGKWTLFGITSFGEGCGRKGKYGIYAKVSNFVTWIQKTIEKHSR